MHFIKIFREDDSGKALHNSLITQKYLHVSSSQRAAEYFHSIKTITVLSSTQKTYFKKTLKILESSNYALVTLSIYRKEENPEIRGGKALRGVFHILT